jgi:hypothetical protein
VASIKQTVYRYVQPYSLVETDRRFRGVYCLHHQGGVIALMMVVVSTSETSVSFYEITRRNIPEHSPLSRCFLEPKVTCGITFPSVPSLILQSLSYIRNSCVALRGRLSMINWKGSGIVRSCPVLGYYTRICLKGRRKQRPPKYS